MLRIVHGAPRRGRFSRTPMPSTPACTCASLPKLSLKRYVLRMERVIAVVCDARGVYPGLPTTRRWRSPRPAVPDPGP